MSEKKSGKNEYGIEWQRLASRLSPYNVKKGLRYLSHYGWKGFWVKLTERFSPEEIPYGPWIAEHLPTKETLEKQKKRTFSYSPKISILVPLYETPERYFIEMVVCMIEQSYGNWELCLADASKTMSLKKTIEERFANEPRIKYQFLEENKGISENTNQAINMATGDFLGLLDHDDLLTKDALFEVVNALNNAPDAQVLYSDEDKTDETTSEFFRPHMKPDFNPDLLRSNNYICHFFVVEKSLAEQVGGIRSEFDGAQDYDFILRCTEQARKVVHIPRVLYHWRVHKDSTAENPASKMYAFDAGKRAIEEHLKRIGMEGQVLHTKDLGFYRVKYQVKGQPLISILIPNKDQSEVLEQCLQSIQKSIYTNYEILIIENNSVEEKTFAYYKELEKQENIRILYWKEEFNYSAINNFGAKEARGEFLILLNNDVEIISPDWIEEMLSLCQREQVGIVGTKLYYPDDTIQHGGTVIGIGGIAGHVFVNMPRSHSGYMHKASLIQNISAVTAACLMVKKEVYQKVKGFDEGLKVAFNDVDFCLRVREAGYLITYTPYAEAYHHESKSRGTEDSKEKVMRFQEEIEFMRERWIQLLKEGDPYYNKNLTLDKWNYSLRQIRKSNEHGK